MLLEILTQLFRVAWVTVLPVGRSCSSYTTSGPLTLSNPASFLPSRCSHQECTGCTDLQWAAANSGDVRDAGSISGLGRPPGEGNGNLLQYSCLENRMDRGTSQATVHGVTKSWIWLKWLSSHRNCHTEWSKSDREGEISYDIPYMWNLKRNDTNELKIERDSHTWRTNL